MVVLTCFTINAGKETSAFEEKIAQRYVDADGNKEEGRAVAAVFEGNLETFKECIECRGVSIDAHDNEPINSFLHMVIAACERDDPQASYWENKKIPKEKAQELLAYMLSKNPDLSHHNFYKKNALTDAAHFKQKDLLDMIAKHMCDASYKSSLIG